MTAINEKSLVPRLAVLAWLVWTVPGIAASGAEPIPVGDPVHGVDYRRLAEAGPQSIHVVSFDLARGNLAVTATVGAGVRGSETVPDMVARLPDGPGTTAMTEAIMPTNGGNRAKL